MIDLRPKWMLNAQQNFPSCKLEVWLVMLCRNESADRIVVAFNIAIRGLIDGLAAHLDLR